MKCWVYSFFPSKNYKYFAVSHEDLKRIFSKKGIIWVLRNLLVVMQWSKMTRELHALTPFLFGLRLDFDDHHFTPFVLVSFDKSFD